jgi:hypothetical protein
VRARRYRFLQHHRAAATQQIEAGLVAIVEWRRHGCACGHLQLGRGGVVDQQEFALFVLNGHARWKQAQNVAQDFQFAAEIAFTILARCARLKVVFGETTHARSLAKSLVVLVKWN